MAGTFSPARATTTLCTGPARVGKTAFVVHWLTTQFIPFEDGFFYHNLPLKPERIADYCERSLASRLGCTRTEARAEILGRIRAIPRDIYESWRGGKATPQAYFEGKDERGHDRVAAGTVIVIDEAHEIAPVSMSKQYPHNVESWRNFLGFLGHPGGSIILMTQFQWKVDLALRDEAAVLWFLSSLKGEIDWFTGFYMDDTAQLWAKLTGKFKGGFSFKQAERDGNRFAFKPIVPGDGKERPDQMSVIINYEAKWFDCYDSNSHRDPTKPAYKRPLMAYERLTWPWFLRWFVSHNAAPCAKWGAGFAGIFCYFAAMGVVQAEPVTWGISQITGTANKTATEISPVTLAAAPAAKTAGAAPGKSLHKVTNEELTRAIAKETIDQMVFDAALIIMAEGHVVFDDGALIKIGEAIPNGFHKGKTIARIDLTRRIVGLSDGRVLRFATKAKGRAASPGLPEARTGSEGGELSPEIDTGLPAGLTEARKQAEPDSGKRAVKIRTSKPRTTGAEAGDGSGDGGAVSNGLDVLREPRDVFGKTVSRAPVFDVGESGDTGSSNGRQTVDSLRSADHSKDHPGYEPIQKRQR